MDICIRAMTIEDYEEVFALWKTIHRFAIRSMDDSKDGIERFLKRNPGTSVVALLDGKIVGTILVGHDGRCGYFYHVCVSSGVRGTGAGELMVETAKANLQKEGITRVNLVAFLDNKAGNRFWEKLGWNKQDMNYYESILNSENTMRFNP